MMIWSKIESFLWVKKGGAKGLKTCTFHFKQATINSDTNDNSFEAIKVTLVHHSYVDNRMFSIY